MENTKIKKTKTRAKFGDEKQFLTQKLEENFGKIGIEKKQNSPKKAPLSDDVDFSSNAKICNKIEKNTQNLPKSECKNNKLQILQNLELEDWVVLVFEVSPFISSMYEFVDGLFDKLAFSNQTSIRRKGDALSIFEDAIDVLERKKQLVNLSVVANRLISMADEEEFEIAEATLTHRKTISEIAFRGDYRWVYRARDRFVKKVAENCRLVGWTEEFFTRHFASEPLVQYYAFSRKNK